MSTQTRDAVHAGPQPQLAAEIFELADQLLEDQADAFQRPGKALAVDAAEHDAELAEFQVALARRAVKEDRAQQHLDPGQRLSVNVCGHKLAGRGAGRQRFQVVVIGDLAQQHAEVVDLARKLAGDLALQQLEVVVELQAHAGKGDPRSDLRHQAKVVPTESQLTQQQGQRPALGSLGREVGHGVQADVVIAAADPIERIQPADRRVAFEDADAAIVIGQPNARRQTGEPRADDYRVVLGRVGHGEGKRLGAREANSQCRLSEGRERLLIGNMYSGCVNSNGPQQVADILIPDHWATD